MRRTLISLTTTAALLLGAAPAAQAVPTSSEIAPQIKEIPAELRPGSSAVEILSANPSPEQQLEAAALLAGDWLAGLAAIVVIGGVIQAVSAHVR
jgi:hypothetical protein